MNQTQERTGKAAERVIADASWTIGKTWARYGLHAAGLALDASATTLQKTAALLGDLSKSLADERATTAAAEEQPAEPPPASTPNRRSQI